MSFFFNEKRNMIVDLSNKKIYKILESGFSNNSIYIVYEGKENVPNALKSEYLIDFKNEKYLVSNHNQIIGYRDPKFKNSDKSKIKYFEVIDYYLNDKKNEFVNKSFIVNLKGEKETDVYDGFIYNELEGVFIGVDENYISHFWLEGEEIISMPVNDSFNLTEIFYNLYLVEEQNNLKGEKN